MSTTQPPSAQTIATLLALQDNAAPLTFRLWQIKRLKFSGTLAPLQAGNGTPFVPSVDQVAAQALMSRSGDVNLMLAASEFWSRTQVRGVSWSESGAGQSEVTLAIGNDLKPETRRHQLQAVSMTQYTASVRDVPQTMQSAIAGILDAVQAQAELPFVLLALKLGMGKDPARWVNTCLAIDCVSAVVSVAVQRLKFQLRVPRPNDPVFAAGITPLIDVPGYTAFPSGHATLCHALAIVLGAISGGDAAILTSLKELADEIAVNRERAGLHCALDTQAGRQLGEAMGSWMLEAAGRGQDFAAWAALYASAAVEWNTP